MMMGNRVTKEKVSKEGRATREKRRRDRQSDRETDRDTDCNREKKQRNSEQECIEQSNGGAVREMDGEVRGDGVSAFPL